MDKSKVFNSFVLFLLLNLECKGYAENVVFYRQPGQSTDSALLNITDDLNTFTIRNIYYDSNFGFLTIAVHTFLENVTLSYLSIITNQDHVTGTNIGLFWDRNLGDLNQVKVNETNLSNKVTKSSDSSLSNDPVFYLFRNSKTKFGDAIQVYLVLSYYEKGVPVPGGCNLSFESMIAPYQKVFYDEDLITVLSQPSSCTDDPYCNKNLVDVTMYHLFFTSKHFEPSDYFNAIEKMSTVNSIKRYGRVVPSADYAKTKRRFSLYKGTGEVFAIVATYNGTSSAYIPAATFGCDLGRWYEACTSIASIKWTSIAVLSLMLGSFMCFFGHGYFKTTMFLVGFFSAAIIAYSAWLLFGSSFSFSNAYTPEIIFASTSLFSGLSWFVLWMIFQSPLINTHLTFLLANVFIVCSVFFTGLADYSIIFTNDIVYWLSFSCMMLSFLIVWTTFALHISHMMTLSVIGSFLIMLSASYFLGGNLVYIFINIRRRLGSKNFNWAVVSPPFSTLDLVQIIVTITVIVIGFLVQWKNQRGKPAFPFREEENITRANAQVNERTPLLSDNTTSSGPAAPEYA